MAKALTVAGIARYKPSKERREIRDGAGHRPVSHPSGIRPAIIRPAISQTQWQAGEADAGYAAEDTEKWGDQVLQPEGGLNRGGFGCAP
jgi:hypothetical protein